MGIRDSVLVVQNLRSLFQERGGHRVGLAIKLPEDDPARAELPLPAYQRQWLKIWFAVYEPLTPKQPKE
jgi:hypothetical protein